MDRMDNLARCSCFSALRFVDVDILRRALIYYFLPLHVHSAACKHVPVVLDSPPSICQDITRIHWVVTA